MLLADAFALVVCSGGRFYKVDDAWDNDARYATNA